jgi:hypothetical protein
MHNLHLVLVHATSPEDACIDAEDSISDFGTENNWRCIGGCVSEDNEICDMDEYSRWYPSYTDDEGNKPYGSIEALNKMMRDIVKDDNSFAHKKDLIDAIDNGNIKLSEITDSMDLYYIKQYITNRQSTILLSNPQEFNVLEDEYKANKYDYVGVTDLRWSEKGEGEKSYVVLVDMHS